MTPADRAHALREQHCPHYHYVQLRAYECLICTTAALTEYGDARAREEREACANVAQEQAHTLASGAARESRHDDPIDIAVALSNEAAIARRIERLIRAGARPPVAPDEDGHCRRCGEAWPDERDTEEAHECPPGFARTP